MTETSRCTTCKDSAIDKIPSSAKKIYLVLSSYLSIRNSVVVGTSIEKNTIGIIDQLDQAKRRAREECPIAIVFDIKTREGSDTCLVQGNSIYISCNRTSKDLGIMRTIDIDSIDATS